MAHSRPAETLQQQHQTPLLRLVQAYCQLGRRSSSTVCLRQAVQQQHWMQYRA
jgi:hypothetical protein